MKRSRAVSKNNDDYDNISGPTKKYNGHDYLSSLNVTMNENRRRAKFTDIVLVVGGREFPCHKVVLVSGSDYFKGMFSPGMVENQKDKVTIRGVEAVAMETLLDYMYTGNVTITNENVQTLLEAANLLLVSSLVDVCLSFMFDFMDSSNCLGIWQILDSLCLSESCRKAKNYALEYFKVVCCCDEYLDLSIDLLSDLISDTALKVDQEKTIYEAVMKWFYHDTVFRCKDLAAALELVKVELIDSQYLIDRIERDVSPVNWELAVSVMDKLMDDWIAEKRNSNVIAIVGGSPGPGVEGFHFWRYTADNTIYYFNPLDRSWNPLTRTEQFNIADDVAFFDNKIYVPSSEKLRVFDVDKQIWSDADIPHKLEFCFENYCLKWTILQGKIYILIAYEEEDYVGEEDIDSSERFLCYDFSSKEVVSLVPPAKNVALSVAVLFRKRIYVFGEIRNTYPSRSVMQCYDCESNRWRGITDIPSEVPMDDINAVVFDRFIYLFQNASRLYVYDAMDNEWRPSIPGIEEHREYTNCGAAVCNCKLYIMGGQSEDDGTNTDRIYCYDPVEVRWETCGQLKQPLASPRCVTIKKPPWC